MRIRKKMLTTLWAMILVVVACGALNTATAQEAPAAAFAARHELAGSWLVTYDVAAFGGAFPLLLSVGNEGVVIETDAPGKFPLGPGLLVILTNGHGAWEPALGRDAFTYLYRKLIYREDGVTPFGTTRTRGNGSLSRDGLTFKATIAIEIADLTGQVFFVAEGTATGSKIRVE